MNKSFLLFFNRWFSNSFVYWFMFISLVKNTPKIGILIYLLIIHFVCYYFLFLFLSFYTFWFFKLYINFFHLDFPFFIFYFLFCVCMLHRYEIFSYDAWNPDQEIHIVLFIVTLCFKLNLFLLSFC